MEAVSLAVAVVSLGVSALTAWLTMGRRGRLRLAQPATVYFGPDGNRERHPKVFIRGLLYATASRGMVIEGMFVRLRRGDSTQTFPIWVHGEKAGDIARGAGLSVPQVGTALHHHFLLPSDGTTYSFLPGTYTLEIFAVIVGRRTPELLASLDLPVNDEQAKRLREDNTCGLYFDWGPDTRRYHGHIKDARLKPEELDSLMLLAGLAGGPPRLAAAKTPPALAGEVAAQQAVPQSPSGHRGED